MKAILSLFFVAGIVQLPTVMSLPGKGFLRSVLNEAAEERVEDRVLDYFADDTTTTTTTTTTDDDTVVTVVQGLNCNYLFCLSGSDW